jgi:hypothetical protein
MPLDLRGLSILLTPCAIQELLDFLSKFHFDNSPESRHENYEDSCKHQQYYRRDLGGAYEASVCVITTLDLESGALPAGSVRKRVQTHLDEADERLSDRFLGNS